MKQINVNLSRTFFKNTEKKVEHPYPYKYRPQVNKKLGIDEKSLNTKMRCRQLRVIEDLAENFPKGENEQTNMLIEEGLGIDFMQEYWDENKQGWRVRVAGKTGKSVHNCRSEIDLIIAHFMCSDEKRAVKRQTYREKNAEQVAMLETNNVSDAAVRANLEILIGRRAFITLPSDMGHHKIMMGRYKGSLEYSLQQAAEIKERARKLKRMSGTMMFLTLTVDPKKVDYNALKSWTGKKSFWKRFTEKMKILGDFSFVQVQEATNKGFIHLHVLFKFKNQHFATFKDKNNVVRIARRELRNLIQSFWRMGHADLRAVTTKDIDRYMTKYISKGMSPATMKAVLEKSKLSEDERKIALGLVMAVASGTRSFTSSRDLSNPKAKWVKPPPLTVAEIRATKKRFAGDKQGEALALIRLKNNSLLNCCKGILFTQNSQENPIPSNMSSGTFLKGIKEIDNLVKNGQHMGCRGCIFREKLRNDIIDYRKNYPDRWEKDFADIEFPPDFFVNGWGIE